MKRILITGSNGLLGQKLVAHLRNRSDVALIATAKGENRLPFTQGYTYEPMDITDAQQVAAVFAKTQPHAVIHAAAMTHVDVCVANPEACWEVNVNAVAHLLEASKRWQAYFCYVSTDFVFDGEAGPYREDDQPNPVSLYGKSKLAAETLVQASGLAWSIIRTVLVYGIAADMSRSNLILWVKKSLEKQQAIKVVNDQWRTPTLAEDLALGCWLAVAQQAQGIFHISGKDLMSPYQMALKTAHFFGLDASLIQEVNASVFHEPDKRPPRTGFILTKAQQQLGYQPHSFDEGLAILAQQLTPF